MPNQFEVRDVENLLKPFANCFFTFGGGSIGNQNGRIWTAKRRGLIHVLGRSRISPLLVSILDRICGARRPLCPRHWIAHQGHSQNREQNHGTFALAHHGISLLVRKVDCQSYIRLEASATMICPVRLALTPQSSYT